MFWTSRFACVALEIFFYANQPITIEANTTMAMAIMPMMRIAHNFFNFFGVDF
jgi:hypothetical protein